MKRGARIFNEVEINRSAQKTSYVSLRCDRILDALEILNPKQFSIVKSRLYVGL